MISISVLFVFLASLFGITYADISSAAAKYENHGAIPGQYEVFLETSLGNSTSSTFIVYSETPLTEVTYPDTTHLTSSILNETFFVSWTPSSPNSSVPVNISLVNLFEEISLGLIPNLGNATFNLSLLRPSLIPSPGWSVSVSSPIFGTNQSGPVVTFTHAPNISVITSSSAVLDSYINVTWVPFNIKCCPQMTTISILNSTDGQSIYSIEVPDFGNALFFLNSSFLTAPNSYFISVMSMYGIGTSAAVLVFPIEPPTPSVAIVNAFRIARAGKIYWIDYLITGGAQTLSLSFLLVAFNGKATASWKAATLNVSLGRVYTVIPACFPTGAAAIYTIVNGLVSKVPLIIKIA
ncbi:hypothetical protein MDAP_000500 [Mitosporidium daphniae]|uniref:Fibronectin type-III domain-containing protein n=1 Tax=Mitosporidium daphniae TaxID=1485682 RepID=A0A098VV47_9MICR|nr:uncharacterized protein DI09_30p120 [Mitosporidium daphniae]KGG51596.1 hypothetical protein DI09_30p120 [Mitosporidium daphniae]|eukprot:XP_013238023.1 uncharacterized protein DI09_30p120 [Mitosporidium daphniae]